MSQIKALTHIGITVQDLERSVKFYCENFDMVYRRGAQFGEPFFEKNKSLYQLENITCKTAVLDIPGGSQLELFQFSDNQPQEEVPWNRAGITHIALETDDVQALSEKLRANGVVFCIDVGTRPDNGHWVFVRDPDANLIEVMEPFNM